MQFFALFVNNLLHLSVILNSLSEEIKLKLVIVKKWNLKDFK